MYRYQVGLFLKTGLTSEYRCNSSYEQNKGRKKVRDQKQKKYLTKFNTIMMKTFSKPETGKSFLETEIP